MSELIIVNIDLQIVLLQSSCQFLTNDFINQLLFQNYCRFVIEMSNKQSLKSKNCLKNKFKELIQSLRNQTHFKQKIPYPSNQLLLQSHQLIQKEIDLILPVTQINSNQASHQNLSSCSQNSLNILGKLIKERDNMENIEEFIDQSQVDESNSSQSGRNLLVNEITDLLKPESKLQLLKNQGRSGCIRRQRFTISTAAKSPKYVKIPRNKQYLLQQTKQTDLNVIKKISIKELDDIQMIKYWNTSKKIDQNSSIEDIYNIFSKLIDDLNIDIASPTIKKYKNCVYFGSKPEESLKIYQGIIYYFQNKIYYGQMLNGIKHGYGTELNFNLNTKFAGNFEQGKKTGYFFVQKQRENYEGMVEHGIYQGQGKLMTEDCVYIGSFVNGKKNGFGEQFYPKTGLRLRGSFKNGEYLIEDKSKLEYDPSSEKKLRSKPQKILSKSNAYNIDFQLQNTFKRQIQEQSPKSKSLYHQDSQSLFDLVTSKSRVNKYDYISTQKFPKIRIEGIQTHYKQIDPQKQIPYMKNHKMPSNDWEQNAIKRRDHSHQLSVLQKNQIYRAQMPLSKHKLNLPFMLK